MRAVHQVVAVVHAFVMLVTVVIWAFPTNTDNPGRLAQELILLLSLIIVALALLDVSTRVRVTGSLVVGIVMIPMAISGLAGGWGVMHGFGVAAIYFGLDHEWEVSKPDSEKRAER